MKRAEMLLYSLYAIGIVLKLFKLPMHTVFIMTTLLILIIYYIYCLISKSKDRYSTLVGFATVLWLFGLLAVLKHFPFQNIVLIIAFVSSAALLFIGIKEGKLMSANNIFCLVIISMAVLFKLLPVHSTYYLTNIKFNYEIERDYISWDKYSWFLYKNGKEDEAIQANINAQNAVEKGLQDPNGIDNQYAVFIKQHQQAIKDKTWKAYP